MTQCKVQVTLWYRIHDGKREYNHLQYGWGEQVVPIGDSYQSKIWKGAVWEKELRYALQIEGQPLRID